MANWFVYDTNGNKSGPISSSQLKKLADTRRINRETIIETETGRKAKAAQVKGLFTEKSNSGEAPSAPGKKTSSERTWYYYDVVGIKCGPVNSLQLKKLASSKSINEETVIENQAGRKEKAGNIKGLFPPSTRDITPESQFSPFDTHGTDMYASTAETQSFGNVSANSETLGGYSLEGFTYSDSEAYPVTPVSRTLSPGEGYCSNCGEIVSLRAVACLKCGADPRKHKNYCRKCGDKLNPEQVVCLSCGASVIGSSEERSGGRRTSTRRKNKSKVTAGLLALFFGPLGIHKFYLGKSGMGVLYLILTLLVFGAIITSILSLIDAIVLFCMDDDVFDDTYCIEVSSSRRRDYNDDTTHSKPAKNRLLAALLALFFGLLGVHKFYLGRPAAGVLYIVLTLLTVCILSAILSFIDFIILLCMDDDSFGVKYNPSW
ncbi:MAG: NINE protein [Thermoguttaceae bacterium]|nr:NINE protein [Thermoguttaceae bacterium]